jgi:hypothetical protein
MNSPNVLDVILQRVRFVQKWNGTCHINVISFAAQFSVSEESVRQSLVFLADRGVISLKTWSKSARREISFRECPTTDFFYNPEDNNYVRAELLTA